MTRRLLILVVVLFASPALAQQTAKAQGIITVSGSVGPPPPPPGLGWTDVTGQKQSNVCPPNPGTPGACNGVVDAWSGGFTDTKRGRLWWWGGGHTDYSGNELYYYDLSSRTVVRADNPSTPTMCVTENSDSTPSSRHNYGSLVYIPTADVAFEFGGGGWCNAGFASSDTWTLNLSQVGGGAPNGWKLMDPTLGNGGVHPDGSLNNMQAAYDPVTDRVYVNDNVGGSGLWSYNFAANAYTHLNAQPALALGLHTRIVVDPVRHLIVRFGDGAVSTIDISSGSAYAAVTKTGTGCSALINANNPGLAFDTVLSLVVGWPNFGPSVVLYNPDTDSCTTQTYVPNAPPDSSHTGSPSTTNGTFGRWGYFPAFGYYALVNEWNIDVHLLQITAPNADFATRCASAGVIRCVAFDSASEADVTTPINPGGGAVIKQRLTCSVPVASSCPTIDNSVFASGGGSLHFVIPAGTTQQNAAGQYNTDFTDDFHLQADSLINGDPLSPTTACGGSPCPNEIFIQFRQRFSPTMLQHFAGSNGFKQMIVGEGDQPGFTINSCTVIELPIENSVQLGIPRMYNSCGFKLDEFDPLTTPTGRTDGSGNGLFSPQNVAGGYLNCTYAASINIATIPPCVPYVANQWMTFQWHIIIGTWFPAGSPPSPAEPFRHDSTVQLWVSMEGQPAVLVIDYHPGATSPSCDATQSDIPTCQTGYDLDNTTAFGNPDQDGNHIHAKFGQVWLLPYQTNCCTSGNTDAAADTWFDELIISTKRIPDPLY